MATRQTVPTGSAALEPDVIEVLAGSGDPIGSSQLQERLEQLGHQLSEPTVGRLLTRLDRRGLTVRVSNRGRILTPAGRKHREQLRLRRERQFFEEQFLSAMNASTIREIEDVLVARRAIERESARLAALHATAEDIARLRAFLDDQTPSEVRPGVHDMIATISGNRVLAAALALINNNPVIHARMRALLQAEHVLFDAIFHERLVDAVTRHDPEGAEHAMEEHLDRMLDAVRRFSAEQRPVASGKSPRGAKKTRKL